MRVGDSAGASIDSNVPIENADIFLRSRCIPPSCTTSPCSVPPQSPCTQ